MCSGKLSSKLKTQHIVRMSPHDTVDSFISLRTHLEVQQLNWLRKQYNTIEWRLFSGQGIFDKQGQQNGPTCRSLLLVQTRVIARITKKPGPSVDSWGWNLLQPGIIFLSTKSQRSSPRINANAHLASFSNTKQEHGAIYILFMPSTHLSVTTAAKVPIIGS